MIAKIYRK